jgi:hypothetical protein
MNISPTDQFHRDPSNWVLGFLYFARADRRLVVPKRLRWLGWTLNFARPLAFPLLLAVWAVLFAPLVALVRFHALSPASAFCSEVVLVVALIGMCVHLANSRNA